MFSLLLAIFALLVTIFCFVGAVGSGISEREIPWHFIGRFLFFAAVFVFVVVNL